MKKSRRFLSLIMVVCILFSAVPAVAAVEDTATYGASIGTGISAVADRHNILLGDGDAKWLVLDADMTTAGTAGIAVISEDVVANDVVFNAGGLKNTWTDSDAKAWLGEFATSEFDAVMLSAIMDTTKDVLAGDKLFFLSAEEVSQYFYSGSINGLIAEFDGVAEGWWLRTAYAERDIFAGVVSDTGFIGYPHVGAAWGARPAFNISADAVAVSSAAVGGKVSGAVGADALVAVEQAESAEWKLTLINDAYASFAATIGDGSGKVNQVSGYDAWQLPITYSGAVTGENEYVSVMICNQAGEAIYYGHIAANSASGSVDVNMPAGLSGVYTIHVFAEQCNGDNATDFGSALISAEVVIDDQMSKVDTWGLTLEGDIQADFVLDITESAAQSEGAYVSVTVAGQEEQIKISDITPDENGKYLVTANVAAAQMTEDIAIQVITAEKEGSKFYYSVSKYGNYILDSEEYTADLKDLVKAMLAYGGKAQDYFDYNTNDLADNGIAIASYDIPYTEGLAPVKEGNSQKVLYYGASLIHESQTAVRFYFLSGDASINIASVKFADGSVQEMDLIKSGSLYYVQIDNIAPNCLCDDIVVTVDGLSVTYSPFYYIHRMYYNDNSRRVMREMMQALYNYYCYAAAYVGK